MLSLILHNKLKWYITIVKSENVEYLICSLLNEQGF